MQRVHVSSDHSPEPEDRVRRQLQEAVRKVPVDPALRARIRQSIGTKSPAMFWQNPWLAVMAAALLSFLVVQRYLHPPNIVDAAIGDHQKCALEGRLVVSATSPLLKPLATGIDQRLPAEYRLASAHECHIRDTAFLHFVLQNGVERVSLVVAGATTGTAAGDWSRATPHGRFLVSSQRTGKVVFVLVSALPPAAHSGLAQALPPALLAGKMHALEQPLQPGLLAQPVQFGIGTHPDHAAQPLLASPLE
jgi:hypothetical protein